jgi:hypothetical protein
MPTRYTRYYFVQPTAVAPSTVGSRFVDGDEPPQSTFQKLFDSSGFISEAEDKAKINEQGFVRIVSDSDAKSNINPAGTWVYAAQPSQLPTSSQGALTLVSDEPSAINVVVDPTVSSRNSYLFNLATDFKVWLFNQLVPSGGTTGQSLVKVDGTDFNVGWTTPTVVEGLPSGGTSAEVLTGDRLWTNPYTLLGVNGGTTGQSLIKNSGTNGDYSWGDVDTTIAGGTTGQVLKKISGTSGDYGWQDEASTTYTSSNVGTNGENVFKGQSGNQFQFHKVAIDPSAISALTLSLNSDEIRINLDGITSDDITVQGVTYGGLSPASNSLTDVLQALFNAHP